MRGGGDRKEKEAPSPPSPPKGCMAIRVGCDGEEMHRFVVPVEYVNHPLFVGLLKEAEEVFGFEQEGAIRIPCRVKEFCHVRRLIDRENAAGHAHHLHLYNCFKA